MYQGNFLERVCCLCELVFCTWEYTIDTNLWSCVLNRHNLRQSQIATSQEILPSQFVICRNSWPRLCRGKFSQLTLKMCSVYLGEYPSSVLTGIWEVEYWPIFVLNAICIVYNSPNMRCRNEHPDCNLLHRYFGYHCCKLLTSFSDFVFWAITKLYECPNNLYINSLMLLTPCKDRCDK